MITYVQGGKTLVVGENTTTKLPDLDCGGNGSIDIVFGATADHANHKFAESPDNDSTLYVTVLNVGTNEIVQSNAIKYHQ